MEAGQLRSGSGDEDNPLAPTSGNAGHEQTLREESHEFPRPPEILESLPQEQKQQIERFFSSAMSMTMGMGNPIAEKVKPEHITDVIALTGKEVDREYDDRRHSRLVTSIVMGFCLVVILVFAGFLAYNQYKDLLLELAKVGVALVGGFGGGYGFAHWRR